MLACFSLRVQGQSTERTRTDKDVCFLVDVQQGEGQ